MGTGIDKGSPTSVFFLTLQHLSFDNLKEIIEASSFPHKNFKKWYSDLGDEKNLLIEKLVAEFGILPRVMRIVFLILDGYFSTYSFEENIPSRFGGGEAVDKLVSCFSSHLQINYADVVTRPVLINDWLFFNGAVILMALKNYNVKVKKKAKFFDVPLERLVGFCGFSKKNIRGNGIEEEFCLSFPPFLCRTLELNLAKKTSTVDYGMPSKMFNCLTANGNLLEFAVGKNILLKMGNVGTGVSIPLFKDVFGSTAFGSSTLGNQQMRVRECFIIPKLTTKGSNNWTMGNVNSSLKLSEELISCPSLRPEKIDEILNGIDYVANLERWGEKDAVLLCPRAMSRCSDAYLFVPRR